MVNEAMSRTLIGGAVIMSMLLSHAVSSAQVTYPLFYDYVVANYTCRKQFQATPIKVYSQVFAACYADGQTHIGIMEAGNDLSIAEQAAKLECRGGTIGPVALKVGDAHTGPAGRDKTEQERADRMKDFVFHGGRATVFHVVEAVYSKSSCK
jgi:hypothetical protein